MGKTLSELISKEDPKCPLTDEKLAELLGLRREQVIEIRKKEGIPNSRTRLKPILIKEIKVILESNPDLSDRALTDALQDTGFMASRFLVHEIREKLDLKKSNHGEKTNSTKSATIKVVEIVNEAEQESDPFMNMIGWDGGLKAQIHQAKAAISYPPNGLHVMIIGPSGTGKTMLAENMYNYAVKQGILPNSAPMIFFNCAAYADNPQLLNSQLFGYVKGAFSGANDTRDGLVGKADGGILFLDEVHRLSGEGQEMLFYLMDKGAYRRLGDSGPAKHVNVRLIVATTSSPESSLLPTFRRRIPIVISMPGIADRPISERYDLLYHIFMNEQQKLGRKLVVESEAVSTLLNYDCPGNVGQLQSNIQMCCANAFLECNSSGKKEVSVTTDLIKQFLGIDFKNRPFEIDNRYNNKMVFAPENEQIQEQMVGEEEIEQLRLILEEGVENVLGILNPKITPVNNTFKDAIVDCLLSIYIGKEYQIGIEKRLFPKEGDIATRSLAQEFMQELTRETGRSFPDKAVDTVALYLHAFSIRYQNGRVRVIIMTHGRTGEAMADVVNHMLKDDNTIGFSMGWDETAENVLERAIKVVQEADEGRGCLLLADMGSLASFAPEISLRTGVKVRCVTRVDTLMALDAAAKASLQPDKNMDTIADALESARLHVGYTKNKYATGKPPAILTVCLTGEGSAHRIRGFLQATIAGNDKIKLVEVGLLNRDALEESVRKTCQDYDIVAAVGTINPELPGVPFLSKDYVFTSQGTLALTSLLQDYFKEEISLGDLLNPELILCDADFGDKVEAIDHMCQMLRDGGYVTPEFLLSVYKRENIGTTYLKEGIAIPHGDTEFVERPVICIAKMKNKLEWAADSVVDYVFLFALTEDCQKYVQKFYDRINDEKALKKLMNAGSKEEIFKSLK